MVYATLTDSGKDKSLFFKKGSDYAWIGIEKSYQIYKNKVFVLDRNKLEDSKFHKTVKADFSEIVNKFRKYYEDRKWKDYDIYLIAIDKNSKPAEEAFPEKAIQDLAKDNNLDFVGIIYKGDINQIPKVVAAHRFIKHHKKGEDMYAKYVKE